MTDVLNVSLRNETGTRLVRRLRSEGLTPAILYGHGKESVSLSVPTAELEAVVRHGIKMVDLSGGVTDKALIRAIQWDTFGSSILHLDLNRVSATERVVVTVPIELRGEAPGSKLGGVVDHNQHELEIECPAGEIPDKVTVSLKSLEIGESITVGQVELPASIKVLTPENTVVVNCQAQIGEDDEEQAEGIVGAEPEVIGRKAEDDEENSG